MKKALDKQSFAAYYLQQPKTRALICGQVEYITRKQLAAGKLDGMIVQVDGQDWKIEQFIVTPIGV